MQDDDVIDEMLTQHAVFKILDKDIIPCSCRGFRKIVQQPGSLITQCLKCNSKEPFNISDLAIIGGALLKLATAEGNTDFKAPDVTTEQIYQMIEDFQEFTVWVKEHEKENLRSKLKILKGGLSK